MLLAARLALDRTLRFPGAPVRRAVVRPFLFVARFFCLAFFVVISFLSRGQNFYDQRQTCVAAGRPYRISNNAAKHDVKSANQFPGHEGASYARADTRSDKLKEAKSFRTETGQSEKNPGNYRQVFECGVHHSVNRG
jgi:hypothetical protein